MKRVVMFSNLSDINIDKVTSLLFPKMIENKTFAFMPSDGIVNCKQEYIEQWQDIARKFNSDFVVIDNLANNIEEEISKLERSNILVISGGNTFKLLENLRKSGLDKAVRKFTNKKNFVLGGYSAGALVLTPSIQICTLPKYDKNIAGITDLTGLGIVNFEVFPHYAPEDENVVLDYSKTTKLQVKTITDDGLIELNIS